MSNTTKARKFFKPSVLRVCTITLVFVAFLIGLVANNGWGTLSSMGIGVIAAICPLGVLEAGLGAWSLPVRAVIVLVLFAVAAFFLGRSFCSWACPVPAVDKVLKPKKRVEAEKTEQAAAADRVLARFQCAGGCGSCMAKCAGKDAFAGALKTDGTAQEAAETASVDSLAGEAQLQAVQPATRRTFDSRHVVLLAALLSAAIFGFPVFCIVCPIGLSFATIIALVQLVAFNEPSWGLLIFPLIMVFELTVLRHWCGMICPMGALMSLLSHHKRTVQPRTDPETCLRANGEACTACAKACPQHIDPCANLGDVSMAECTRCGACVEACPTGALCYRFGGDGVGEVLPAQPRA